jgi:hypothetical protein
MMPVRKAAVIGLLEWIRRNRPHVRSLGSLNREGFMELVTEYELSKGVVAINSRSSNLRAKWQSAHYIMSQYPSDHEALANYPQ